MKIRTFLSVLMSTTMLTAFVACDKTKENTPDDKPSGQDSTQIDEFSRMMLLEQFTSEHCPNCPNGVMQIDNYLTTHKNVVWLSHHSGYKNDQWTINESASIVRLLGVSGAPTIALNRANLTASSPSGSTSGYNLHPYYLAYLTGAPDASTTASVHITNSLEAGTLKIHVEGKLKADAPKDMLLTVCIKENGLHGGQSDPQNTLAGTWADYVHSDVIRTFVSAIGGDPIVAQDNQYQADYEVTLNPAWVADNCMVVAFLTDDQSLNVVQAAEQPVVEGTKGGADLPHGGVTPKPVPDGYPEGQYSMAEFIKADTVVFQHAQLLSNSLDNGMREWHIMAWTTAQTYGSGANTHHPFADIVFFTEGNQTTIPTTGEYRFAVARNIHEIIASTAWAGYCDVEAQRVIGSELQIVNKAQFETGNIVPGTNGRWLIAEGSITFRQDGFYVNATSATGKPIQLLFTGTYRQ